MPERLLKNYDIRYALESNKLLIDMQNLLEDQKVEIPESTQSPIPLEGNFTGKEVTPILNMELFNSTGKVNLKFTLPTVS